MVLGSQCEYDSQWAAICSIAPKIGCISDTLRVWVRQHERNTGGGDSVLTIGERQRLKELEHENRELRRSNDILRQASAYFAKAELDCLWSSACMNHCSATGAVNSRHYFQCELAMPPVAYLAEQDEEPTIFQMASAYFTKCLILSMTLLKNIRQIQHQSNVSCTTGGSSPQRLIYVVSSAYKAKHRLMRCYHFNVRNEAL
ncbi:IS1203 transposase orfA [Escherichia coli]|nr:IS1203 transposase orfA [Escherichia coli]